MTNQIDKFNEHVLYLEDEDVDERGTLSDDVVTIASEKPIFIMIQGSFCGWTQKAKPVFQAHADATNQQIQHATILIDGNKSEQKLGERIGNFVKEYNGVPTFVLFVNGRYISTHNNKSKK